VNIVVNGNSIDVPRACNIVRLLEQLDLDGRHVAVELNRAILPHEDHASRLLEDNDSLEIVTFVGGG
jgi:sulfur carrier protein